MKSFLQTILYFISACIALVITVIILSNRPLPHGVVGPGAEALTDSMMAAVNCAEWSRLRYVSWSYQGRHDYVWDKLYNLAEIRYRDVRILLNLNTRDGIVWKKGVRLSVTEKRVYLAHAWKIWVHDSFWLNPICKLRDGGAVRRLVPLENNQNGLLVTYTRSGISPGDSFLWYTNPDFIPTTWRMWVRFLPVRGLKASWEQWVTTGNVRISVQHRIGPYRIEIRDLRSGAHHTDLGLKRDPFTDFVTE